MAKIIKNNELFVIENIKKTAVIIKNDELFLAKYIAVIIKNNKLFVIPPSFFKEIKETKTRNIA